MLLGALQLVEAFTSYITSLTSLFGAVGPVSRHLQTAIRKIPAKPHNGMKLPASCKIQTTSKEFKETPGAAMRAMTIRISDRAYEHLQNLEAADGVPPAIRARKWILDEINKDMPPALVKKLDLGLDKQRRPSAPSGVKSPNARKKN